MVAPRPKGSGQCRVHLQPAAEAEESSQQGIAGRDDRPRKAAHYQLGTQAELDCTTHWPDPST